MTTTTHQSYKASSPYYRGILDQWGRWLTYSQTAAILAEHGAEMEALYVREHGPIPAAADTDALALVQWLGY